MKKFLFIFFSIPWILGASDYLVWQQFVSLNYQKGQDNGWFFAGKLRGGYVFLVGVRVSKNSSDEYILVRGPDNKIKEIHRRVRNFIFDGNKFFYSSSSFRMKITGYGLNLTIKVPHISIKGKPKRKFVSFDETVNKRKNVFSFPMWKWKFKGYFIINGMKFKVEWIVPFHIIGELSGPVIVGKTEDYSFFFYKPNSSSPLLIFEKNSEIKVFKNGLLGVENGNFAFTGRGMGIYLTFRNSPACIKKLSFLHYRIIFHPPYQVLPGMGIFICFDRGT